MALLLTGLLGCERSTGHSAGARTYFPHYGKAQKQALLRARETPIEKALEEKRGEITKCRYSGLHEYYRSKRKHELFY